VSRETDLKTAIAYLIDLNAELDERSAVSDPAVHAGARADMLYQLRHAQRLAGALDREVPIDLQPVKAWTLAVESRLARICGNSIAAEVREQQGVSH
jgi:hypothetical protein